MSKNSNTKRDNKDEAKGKSPVYDFLYCDSRRIASFLAQFNENGYLERIVKKETASSDKNKAVDFSIGGGASILGTGGSANFGIKRPPSGQSSEASERAYDPIWINAIAFLEHLKTNRLMANDAKLARIGDFCLVSGKINIIDMSLFRQIWQMPEIKSIMFSNLNTTPSEKPTISNNRRDRRAKK